MDQYHFTALLAGLLCSISGLLIKKNTESGTGVLRILFVSRWVVLLLVTPLFLRNPVIDDWSTIWSALLVAILVFVAWLLVLISIRMGEVSVQLPITGTKVLFVAVFSLLIMESDFPTSIWIACSLTFVGILVLGLPGLIKKNHSFLPIFLALLSSPLFALSDVIIATDAPIMGEEAFLFISTVFLALLSLFLIPFFKKPLHKTSSFTVRWGFSGAVFIAMEEFCIIYALAFSSQPTVVNTLYNSRGVWSILLVWIIGHWFGNYEKNAGWKVMSSRLAGAMLLTMAIFIILLG